MVLSDAYFATSDAWAIRVAPFPNLGRGSKHSLQEATLYTCRSDFRPRFAPRRPDAVAITAMRLVATMNMSSAMTLMITMNM